MTLSVTPGVTPGGILDAKCDTSSNTRWDLGNALELNGTELKRELNLATTETELKLN